MQAEKRLKPFASRVKLYQSCFSRLDLILEEVVGCGCVDGVFADLGLLRSHSEVASRGFSYKLKGRLDMRYDTKVAFVFARLNVNHLVTAVFVL